MIQGSTPKIRLTLPFDARMCSLIHVAFVDALKKTVILTKEVKQKEIVDASVTIPITQDETRLMKGSVALEVRTRMITGSVIAFKPFPVMMAPLIDGVTV